MGTKKTKKPWEDRWTKVRDLRTGGHGETFVVREAETDRIGVLKVLLSQNDEERRRRFRRETVHLETLNHPRIPLLLDTNAGEFRETTTKLFMVQEFIDGEDLSQFAETQGVVPVPSAIDLTQALLQTLAYCHEQGVGHRDLKPDNIVLRGSEPTDPVLVDFGQSFGDSEAVSSVATYDGQVMGNRFLSLPELTSGNAKRDLRSDLTHLAGVLLFAITGVNPMQLLDGERLPPHRRPDAMNALKRWQQRGPSATHGGVKPRAA